MAQWKDRRVRRDKIAEPQSNGEGLERSDGSLLSLVKVTIAPPQCEITLLEAMISGLTAQPRMGSGQMLRSYARVMLEIGEEVLAEKEGACPPVKRGEVGAVLIAPIRRSIPSSSR